MMETQKHICRLPACCDTQFLLDGFGSNEPVPSVSQARAMHSANLRRIRALRPKPSPHSVTVRSERVEVSPS